MRGLPLENFFCKRNKLSLYITSDYIKSYSTSKDLKLGSILCIECKEYDLKKITWHKGT